MKTTLKLAIAGAALAALAGCHTDMWTQKKVQPQQPSEVFADGLASRQPVPNTVPRGQANTDTARTTGYIGRQYVDALPATLDLGGKVVGTSANLKEVLLRGKERFTIFCSHCHGAAGDGQGMITLRGLKLRRTPASYHTERLRKMPLGHFYDVITNGYGTMFSQAPRVPVDDRWAIVAYIRALQLSHNANPADLDANEMTKIQEAPAQR